VQRDEAERRTSEDTQEARLDAYGTEMVANLLGKEAVIGRDGFTTTKGKSRFYSRSFNYSIVRNDPTSSLGLPSKGLPYAASTPRMSGPLGTR
jgi:hypothetical protein